MGLASHAPGSYPPPGTSPNFILSCRPVVIERGKRGYLASRIGVSHGARFFVRGVGSDYTIFNLAVGVVAGAVPSRGAGIGLVYVQNGGGVVGANCPGGFEDISTLRNGLRAGHHTINEAGAA